MSRLRPNAGFTLIEVLVSMAVFSIFMSGASAFFSDNFRRSKDGEIVVKTNAKAQRLVNLLLYEMRMIGSGVPFSQANFAIGGSGLGNAPNPILTGATATLATVRLSEYGVVSVLEADFDPSSSLTLDLSNVDDVAIGDFIYVSNATTGGAEGLQGEVLSVVGTSVTIDTPTSPAQERRFLLALFYIV
ncbi:MAG: prepilin-type N-terminal cleavage/methylation domain-containing protein [Bdellovibrionales bacterium]|nr:prepilin-type N-terminal cleavage/methylation domain-containing protein [Bdellovibrionales bacterium]